MKIIHDPDTLKETFKNAILSNDCIKIAVFLFEPKILSDICGMEKDDFYEMLKSKLECLYINDWFFNDNEETLEAVKELINELPVHYIESPSKIFHPKVFFFSNSKSNDWEAIISSANITYGLAHDIQSSVHLTQKDDDREKQLRQNLVNYFDYLQTLNNKSERSKRKEETKNKEDALVATRKEFEGAISLFFDTIEPILDESFTSEREWKILKLAMHGDSNEDIVNELELKISEERTRQLKVKGMKRLHSILKTMKIEKKEKFTLLQEAYKNLISNYAYIAAEERYQKCNFFKSRLNLLGRLKKTMAN